MRDFRDLKVWHKAHGFVLGIYRSTRNFPSGERFGLTAHLRKSAASIPTNIAEGCGRHSEKDLKRFLIIAAGSASESEYQLHLAHELGFLSDGDHVELDSQMNEIKRMLNSLINKLDKER